mmetsp:Transcript_8088/g.15986  ORF Transcript_8088/g.15986 Transcript_8088/m.15986 type:complete len:155 (-) Transcript_8088:1270-1734(-)
MVLSLILVSLSLNDCQYDVSYNNPFLAHLHTIRLQIPSNVFQLPEGRMLTFFGIVPEGSILDVPNAALGLVYYSYWLFLGPLLPSTLTVCISSMAMASSVFLAIKLVILKELCLLCWSTHVINSRLFSSVVANLILGGNSGRATKKKEKVIKRV